jgi:hypothetical protein
MAAYMTATSFRRSCCFPFGFDVPDVDTELSSDRERLTSIGTAEERKPIVWLLLLRLNQRPIRWGETLSHGLVHRWWAVILTCRRYASCDRMLLSVRAFLGRSCYTDI